MIVDVRSYSRTFLRYEIFECNEQNRLQIYATSGLAIGFLALEDNTKIQIKSDKPFEIRFQHTLRWDDPDLAIKWPKKYAINSDKFIISMKDRRADTSWDVFRRKDRNEF